MTHKEIEVETNSIMDELIRFDQTLTPEQRAKHRRERGLESFRESLARINRMLDLNAPDVILARMVTSLYRRAWSLWEEPMADALVDGIKAVQRERSHRCVACGIDLPYPVTDSLCAACTISDDEVEDVDLDDLDDELEVP